MDPRAEIEAMERRLRQATLDNDVEAHERLLHASWLNNNANGTVTGKPQLLELLRTMPFSFVSIVDSNVVINFEGQTAIVTGESSRTRKAGNEEVAQKVRFMRVYVRDDTRWQVLAAQATPIP